MATKIETIKISATDTTYSNATTSASGLMSASDKTKLDTIEQGAEVNVLEGVQVDGTDLTIENKKVNIPVGSTTRKGVVYATSYLSSL